MRPFNRRHPFLIGLSLNARQPQRSLVTAASRPRERSASGAGNGRLDVRSSTGTIDLVVPGAGLPASVSLGRVRRATSGVACSDHETELPPHRFERLRPGFPGYHIGDGSRSVDNVV